MQGYVVRCLINSNACGPQLSCTHQPPDSRDWSLLSLSLDLLVDGALARKHGHELRVINQAVAVVECADDLLDNVVFYRDAQNVKHLAHLNEEFYFEL